jgi:hypothetical protein
MAKEPGWSESSSLADLGGGSSVFPECDAEGFAGPRATA